MEKKDPTIYDIAQLLNLNPSTISRGLQGHYTVSKKTQQLIRETAENLGYYSNTFASGLRTRKTRIIGLIIPRVNSDFLASVIAGMEKVVSAAGYTLLITQSLENKEHEISNVRTMISQRVEGLMVSMSEDTSDTRHFAPLSDKKIPLIFFDRTPSAGQFPAVRIDNERAACIITTHLINGGARRIAHIAGNTNIGIYQQRLDGYRRALLCAGLVYDEDLVFRSPLDEQSGLSLAQALKNSGADAVFAANDVSAASCMNALRQTGISTPGQIQIAGFNNDIISRNVFPALTTIENPGFLMGETTATRLLGLLAGQEDKSEGDETILPSELIIRESSGLSAH